MAEPHYLPGAPSSAEIAVAASALPVDDHFFRRYRTLLDAEDAAFDELEHAYEDGDRASFETDLVMWHLAIERRSIFLTTHGLAADVLSV